MIQSGEGDTGDTIEQTDPYANLAEWRRGYEERARALLLACIENGFKAEAGFSMPHHPSRYVVSSLPADPEELGQSEYTSTLGTMDLTMGGKEQFPSIADLVSLYITVPGRKEETQVPIQIHAGLQALSVSVKNRDQNSLRTLRAQHMLAINQELPANDVFGGLERVITYWDDQGQALHTISLRPSSLDSAREEAKLLDQALARAADILYVSFQAA